MNCKEILFLLSVLASVIIVYFAVLRYCFGRNFSWKKIPSKTNKAGLSKALSFSGCLLLAIFIFRVAVGACIKPEEGAPVLNWFEQGVESFFLSLRTFGIEEAYPAFISQIKGLIANGFLETLTVVYASALEIIAPISGGAIILEILSSIFPKIQLLLSFWHLGKRKYYYFNELNAASLALAKSISEEANCKNAKKREKPVLIFADTYVDKEDEREYELLLEAKQYGAICVRDDLAHIPKPALRKKREYYLMDENEFGNLQALANLTEERNLKYIKGAFIYLFVQSDAYVQIEKQVRNKLDSHEDFQKEKDKPRIVPVRGYRNLVHNLMLEVPLYEPLVSEAKNKDLNITILGNGLIGTEAFLSTYWLGQMMVSQSCDGSFEMEGCTVTVNVVSKDDEKDFWSKIDYFNPEIQKTVEKIGSEKNEEEDDCDESLLCYDADAGENCPYCKVRYLKSDLKVGGFWDAETKEIREILSSDYFIVALGNDSDNISIAEKIRSHIGKRHMEKAGGKHSKAVIAYAVFDSDLSALLNKEKCFCSKEQQNGAFDIYMHAFGSLEQVYSCKNVYLSKKRIWSEITGKDGAQYKDSHRQDSLARIGNRPEDYDNSNYDYWANLARALHVKYKVFSLGWIKKSIFDHSDAEKLATRQEEVQASCDRYLRLSAIASAKKAALLSHEEKSLYDDLERKKHRLAWLEHRRWNAFTRTMGYRYMPVKTMLNGIGAHKDMRLKLHSCLVEASLRQIPNAHGEMEQKYMWLPFDQGKADKADPVLQDRLDEVSLQKGYDFKEYDYYCFERGRYSLKEDLLEEMAKSGVPNPDKYVTQKLYEDTVTVQGKSILSVDSVKLELARDYTVIPKKAKEEHLFRFDGTRYAQKSDEKSSRT